MGSVITAIGGTLRVVNLMIWDGLAARGGGIFVQDAEVSLTDVKIRGCEATESGGGMMIDRGTMSAEITGLKKNIATGQGGGLMMTDGSTILLSEVHLDNNEATGVGGGVLF